MIQITAQMRLLLAVEPVDFRKGIDGLVEVCRQRLNTDPMSGALFVFSNRRRRALKILMYDGQGFWLCQKRLSQGSFGWWPTGEQNPTFGLDVHQLQLLLWNGNPANAQVAPLWRPIAPTAEPEQKMRPKGSRSSAFLIRHDLMQCEFAYRGRQVSATEIEFIRQLIADHPALSRRRLSAKLCQAWNWVQPNGQPRDMVARSLMLELHRAGHIQLPARRMCPPNNAAHHRPPMRYLGTELPPLECSLAQLGALRFGKCGARPRKHSLAVSWNHTITWLIPNRLESISSIWFVLKAGRLLARLHAMGTHGRSGRGSQTGP